MGAIVGSEMEQQMSNTQRLLEALSDMLRQENTKQQMVDQVACALRLTVGSIKCLVIDMRDVNEVNVLGGDTETKVDATLEMSDDAFALVCAGKLRPAHALLNGSLKVTGDMVRAMKSDYLFKLLREARPLLQQTLQSRL